MLAHAGQEVQIQITLGGKPQQQWQTEISRIWHWTLPSKCSAGGVTQEISLKCHKCFKEHRIKCFKEHRIKVQLQNLTCNFTEIQLNS